MAADLRRIADAILASVHLPLVRYQPRGRVELHEGLALVSSDLPRFGLNTAVVTRDDLPLERCFALMEAFFSGCKEPYGVRITTGAHPDFEAALCARGWRRGDEMPV